MSGEGLARRANVDINFDGTDITHSIRPYLLSVTYTDNEEDAADDLQIKIQDRDSVWMERWLNDAIDAAATTEQQEVATKTYKVTPAIGLNVRSGPGTNYAKYGALVCGTTIDVISISGGWATINYGGKTAYVSADYIQPLEGERSSQQSGHGPSTVLKIQCVISRLNWEGNGRSEVLDCGQFELDTVNASGPPAVVNIKATSLPYTSKIRQTEKSKAWEAYCLSGIANEIASTNGMACLYESENDPYYARVEQYKTSDISFLSSLCHEAGISLKATNNILVLFDQATYEARSEVLTLLHGGGGYTKYKLDVGSADSLYSSCRVSYVDPKSGNCIEGIAKVEDYNASAKNNQQLEVTAKVSDADEAKRLASKMLRLHNKFSRSASFTIPGNPNIVSGVTVRLIGWGGWNGKYIVKQATHTVDGSGGYTTQINLRRVLEGY